MTGEMDTAQQQRTTKMTTMTTRRMNTLNKHADCCQVMAAATTNIGMLHPIVDRLLPFDDPTTRT
jgi:hypothetical protein